MSSKKGSGEWVRNCKLMEGKGKQESLSNNWISYRPVVLTFNYH